MLCEYLEHRGCFPCKVDNTGIYNPRRKTFMTNSNPYKRKGTPDVFFFWKDRIYFMEVKTPDELGYIVRNYSKLENGMTQSKLNITNQISFLKTIQSKGQIGFFCDTVDRLRIVMEQKPSSVEIC